MRYILPVINLMLTVTLFAVSGLSAALAQSGASQANKAGIEEAIANYLSGGKGDVVRYLMQKGYEGSVAAQFNLGIINYRRQDRAVGLKEARFWFTEAAEEGDLVAQMNLGILQLDAGIAQQNAEDIESGLGWLQRAAESGYRPAQVNLGGVLAAGEVQPGREAEGRAWLQLAAEAGDPRAGEILAAITEPDNPIDTLSALYPVDEQLRSEVYRGGSAVITPDAPVYARPSAAVVPIATVNSGVLVEVLERDAEWVRVKIPAGLPVWLSANTVQIEADLVRVSRLEAPLYSAPSSDAESVGLGTVTKGETLPFMKRQGEWVLVRSPERFVGWMLRSDVQARIEFQLDAPAELSDLANQEDVTGQKDIEPVIARLISDAEILQLPDRGAGVLGVVPAKSEITILEYQDGYGFAEGVPVSGWISTPKLAFDEETEADNPVARAVTDTVPLHSRPDAESAAFGSVPKDTVVQVVERGDQWVRIALGQGSGWIISELISPSQELDPQSVKREQESESGAVAVETETSEPARPGGIRESAPESQADQPLAPLTQQIGEEEELIETAAAQPDATDVAQNTDESKPVNQSGKIKPDSVVYDSNSTSSRPRGRISSSIPLAATPDTAMIKLPEPAAVYGWIFAALLSEQDGVAVILKDGVRIRLDPTTQRNNIVGAVNSGANLKLLDRQGEWVKVALAPVIGWVLSSDIE